jgi:PAS domain S-box-containing protein
LESTREHVSQLIAGEIPFFVLEKLYIRKDGRQIWVQNSVSIVCDAEGNPVHLIAICQDVTERKHSDEQLQKLNMELEERVLRRTAELQTAYEFLRESEAISRLILESMPDAIVIADKDGRIVYGNNQVESLFGYSSPEVLGQPVEMLLPERFHETHIDYREEYRNQPHRRYMGLGRELFGQRKDHSEFPVDVMLSPISNSTTWDVMVTIRDNTEQKQAQEALRANEEKLSKLFQILPVGISFLGKEGQILELNSALTNIVGLSKRELMEGKSKSRKYVRADGSPMSPSELASTRARLEKKTIYNVETGVVKDNGETVWTSVNAAPVDIADVDVVVATIDITERKKAEEALQQNRERLRTLSRRLVEVQEEERRAIARELHDRVGQNLAALNLNLNILRSQLSDEALQIIGTRLDDSVSLVNQILTITRNVMADLRSNVLDDYGLESALREFAEQFTHRTGIQVISDRMSKSIPRMDPSIEMTLLRIAQEALANVARHARANQATITVHADGETVYMAVQDDGIGILSWQKANQPGSHGLRIIRERAEAFGGSLQVHSTYKKGTRIEVKIPLTNSSQNKSPREKRS